jgi:hypothetical protein
MWKKSEYKMYERILELFLDNLGVNLIRREKILRFPYFSFVLTSITYLY